MGLSRAYKKFREWYESPEDDDTGKEEMSCDNWQKCVELSWNQEWTLCSSKHRPLMGYNAMTRAYKRAIGEYIEDEDVLLKAGR